MRKKEGEVKTRQEAETPEDRNSVLLICLFYLFCITIKRDIPANFLFFCLVSLAAALGLQPLIVYNITLSLGLDSNREAASYKM